MVHSFGLALFSKRKISDLDIGVISVNGSKVDGSRSRGANHKSIGKNIETKGRFFEIMNSLHSLLIISFLRSLFLLLLRCNSVYLFCLYASSNPRHFGRVIS